MKILLLFKLLFLLFFFKVIEWYRNFVYYWFFEEVFNGIVKDYVGFNDGWINGGFNIVFGFVGFVFELRGNEIYVDFGVLLSFCLNRFVICCFGFIIVFWMKILNF